MNKALYEIKLIQTLVLANDNCFPGSQDILALMINTHNDVVYTSLTYVVSYCLAFIVYHLSG